MESAESRVGRALPRIIRWAAFFMCLTLLALVVGLVIDDANAHNDKSHSDEQVATLTTLVTNQNAEFAGERQQLLDSLHIVNGNLQQAVAYARAQALRDEAVLVYLRRIGVHLPQSLLTTIPAPKILQFPSSRAVTGKASKSHGKRPKR